MSLTHHATELERDLTERREWGFGFLVSAGLAAWVLSGPFGSSGGGGGGGGTDEPAWSVVIQVMPAVQGVVVGMIALAWIVTQWRRHDCELVARVRGLVLATAWSLVGVALVGSYAALFWFDAPSVAPPVLFFPLEAVDATSG